MVTPDAKREAVAHACSEHRVSQRRACTVLEVDRLTVRYNSVRPDDLILGRLFGMLPVSADALAIAGLALCWSVRA